MSRLTAASVEAEGVVYSERYANNGASPMWCLSNTCVVREEDDVFVSGYEYLPAYQPLNDCRWALYRRDSAGWQRCQADEGGRTREPSPIARLGDHRLLISANPTLLDANARGGGPARPEALEFDALDPGKPPKKHVPVWQDDPRFTEHSYRSFAADSANGEAVIFQNVAYSHSEWSFLDRTGAWHGGRLPWPAYGKDDLAPFGATHMRVNYPVVALENRAVHFLGQSAFDNWDRVRTREDLERYIGPDAGPMGGWAFGLRARRLLYTSTGEIGRMPFGEWMEIDNAFDDGGHVWPCDVHVEDDGTVHLLWSRGPMMRTARDEWFPDIRRVSSIRYARLRDGEIIDRRILAEAGEGHETEAFSEEPPPGRFYHVYGSHEKVPAGPGIATPRFHITPNGRMYVVYYIRACPAGAAEISENRIVEILDDGTISEPTTIPLQSPLWQFFTATPRAGCAPSDTLDLLGYRPGDWAPVEGSDFTEWNGTMNYAQVRITG